MRLYCQFKTLILFHENFLLKLSFFIQCQYIDATKSQTFHAMNETSKDVVVILWPLLSFKTLLSVLFHLWELH